MIYSSAGHTAETQSGKYVPSLFFHHNLLTIRLTVSITQESENLRHSIDGAYHT